MAYMQLLKSGKEVVLRGRRRKRERQRERERERERAINHCEVLTCTGLRECHQMLHLSLLSYCSSSLAAFPGTFTIVRWNHVT
jgi:hypothetical protein